MYEGNKCIVRCDRAGVFFAEVTYFDSATQCADLKDARRLWYWDGAASLSQLALDGVTMPSRCKFTMTVPAMTVLGVIEIIPCTEKAIESIDGVSVWKR